LLLSLSLVGLAFGPASLASAHPHLAATFHLKGSNGYHLTVAAHRAGLPLGKAQRHIGKLTVTARTRTESATSSEFGRASYTVPARFNKQRIRADLGPFGEVRLRFRKRSGFSLPPVRASPKERRPESWTGSLSVSFPGEDDVPLTGPGFEATLRHTRIPHAALHYGG
jgi:hypothetical protein